MSAYTGTYRAQDMYTTTHAVLIAAHNAIHNAIVGTGMLKVSDAEYAGQAGEFAYPTAGAGQTAYVDPAGMGANTSRVDGYKLYKHPTLNLYLLVEFITLRDNSTGRVTTYSFTVATELVGGVLTAAKKSPPIPAQEATLGSGGAPSGFPQWSYNTAPLIASCGSDHFWIYASLTRDGYISRTSYYVLPDKIPALAFGVFVSDVDPTTFLMVAPPRVTRANATYYTEQLSTPLIYGWRVYGMNKGTYELYDAASAGHVTDPAVPAIDEGFRVVRANKYIGGRLHQFNFGYMVRTALTDMLTLPIDLLGTTVPKNYRACLAFGPCSPMTADLTPVQYSVPLLPWEA